MDRRHSKSALSNLARVCVLSLAIASLILISCTVAGAADLGSLTSFLRARNLEIRTSGIAESPPIEVGDTVTFGVAPAGLRASGLVAGQPLKWRVVAVETGVVVDSETPAEQLSSLLLVLDEGSLGLRPVNRFETCMPLRPSGNDSWADSELCAWLNASATGPNGIDFSLDSGGSEGFGLLETAFSSDMLPTLLPFGASPYDQKVVIPLSAEMLAWGFAVSDATMVRNAGSAPYTLQAIKGTSLADVKVNELAHVVPVIRVNTTTLDSVVDDYFESFAAKETLDIPTIYQQPRSVITSTKARATLGQLASVGAAVESVTPAEGEQAVDNLTYQWYQLVEGASQPVAVDATTGLAFEDGQAHPSADAATLRGSAITQAGRWVFYCQVVHDDGQAQSGVNSVPVVISISAPQEASLECAECHSSNIRKIHREVTGREGGYCSVCHRRAPQGWSDNRIPEKGFSDFNISCGLSDAECHGKESIGGAWHGEDLRAKHAITTLVEVGDPSSGKAVKKDYAQLRVAQGDSTSLTANSCSGGVYSTGCHALNSADSSFYFGAMNLMTVHNDYAKAQETGKALVKSDALKSSGCAVCHELDKRPDKIANKDCAACHVKGNGSYFEKTGAAKQMAACLKPLSPKAKASQKLVASTEPKGKPQAAAPASVSLSVQKLVGSLIGTPIEAEPLEAGVAPTASVVLPAGAFPLTSLLGGDSPLID